METGGAKHIGAIRIFAKGQKNICRRRQGEQLTAMSAAASKAQSVLLAALCPDTTGTPPDTDTGHETRSVHQCNG